jgi:hypothetical protein
MGGKHMCVDLPIIPDTRRETVVVLVFTAKKSTPKCILEVLYSIHGRFYHDALRKHFLISAGYELHSSPGAFQ